MTAHLHPAAGMSPDTHVFQGLLEEYRLTEQKKWLASWSPNGGQSWLDSIELTTCLLQHYRQLEDFKHCRALTLRLIRLGAEREVTLSHEVWRLMHMQRDWQALRRLDEHPDLLARSPSLSTMRCVTLGRMRRLRSARGVFDELKGKLAEDDRQYLDARLHWMEDKRKRGLEILEDLEEAKAGDPMYWARRVYLQLEMGKVEGSLKTSDAAYERFPEALRVLLSRVAVFEVLDRKRDASDVLTCLVQLSEETRFAMWATEQLEFLSEKEAPDVLLTVSTLQQKKDYCGPNTLSLMTSFWGCEVNQEDIAVEVWDRGTSTHQMASWARQNGFEVRLMTGSPERIKRFLDLGIPVVTERPWAEGGHYFIFVGYSDAREEFYLRDPDAFDVIRYRYEDFKSLFGGHDCWCLLMVPEDRKSLLEGQTFPGEDAVRFVDGIQDRLYKQDPRELLEELESVDLSQVPNRRDLLKLYLADEINDSELMKEASRLVVERNGEDGNILGRVVRAVCGKLPDEACLGLSTIALGLSMQPGTIGHHVRLLTNTGRYVEAQRWADRMLDYFPGEASSYLTTADLLAGVHAEERALEFLTIAEEIDTGDPFLLARLATSLTKVGNYQSALDLLDEAVQVRPTYFYPRYSRAYCLESAGRHRDAVAAYEENLEVNPWCLYNYRQLSVLLEDAGDVDGAERVIKQGLAKAAMESILGLDLGYLYQRQGRIQDARTQFTRLSVEFPDYTPARVGLARLDLIEGCPEDAVPVLQEAVQEAPDLALAVDLLADCFARLGRHEEEIDLLWGWARSFPLDSQFDGRLIKKLERSGRQLELLEFLEEGAEGSVQPAIFCCRVATVCEYLHRIEEMGEWADRAISLAPRKAWARAIRGDYLWTRQEYESAVECYRESLDRRPGYIWSLQRIAEYYLRLNDDRAIDYARRLVTWDSSYLSFLVDAFQTLGKDEAAYRFLVEEGDIARLPHDVEVHCGILQKRLGNLEVAREHFEKALELTPHSTWAAGWLAEVLEQEGEFEEAEDRLRGALRIDPDCLWVRESLAELMIGNGRESAALEEAEAAMLRRPSNDEVQNFVRKIHARLGLADRGADLLRQFADEVASPADLWSQIGALYLDCDRPEQALEPITKSLNFDSESAWAVRLKGIAEYELDSFKDAESSFQRCLELSPTDAVAWHRLTNLYSRRGDFEKAREVIEARAVVAPDDLQILSLLFDICREGGLWEEGEEQFSVLESRTIHKQYSWLYRGVLRELSNKLEGALEAYDRSLEITPTFQKGLYRRALLLFKLKRPEEALEDLSRAVELYPGNPEVLEVFLWNLDTQSEIEVGFDALRRALASVPDDPELYNLVNAFAEKVGHPLAALEIFRSLEGKVRSPHVLACYSGGAYMSAGDFERAESVFRHALELRQDYYWAHSRLGDVYRCLGKDDRAIESWNACIEIDPDYSWPYQGLIDLYRERGDFENQWRVCARRLCSGPDTVFYQYELQELAIETARVEDFEEQVRQLIHRSRAPHELLTHVAQVYCRVGEFEKALSRVDEAIGLNSRAWGAQAKKGDVLRALGRDDDAVPFYERALQLKPDESHSAIQLFEIRNQSGDVLEERDEFIKVLERMPTDESLFASYAGRFQKDRTLESAEKLLELAARVPQSLQALLTASDMFLQAGKRKRAVDCLNRACSEYPRAFDSYVRLSDIYQRQQKRLPLEQVVLRGLSVVPQTSLELVEALFHVPALGRSLLAGLKSRRFMKEIVHCKSRSDLAELASRCVSRNKAGEFLASMDPLAIACLVSVQAIRAKRLGRAEKMLNVICEIQPTYGYALYLHADTLTQLTRYDQAVHVLRRLSDVRDADDVDRFWELLAINSLRRGDAERAVGIANEVRRKVDTGSRLWTSGVTQLAYHMTVYFAARWSVSEAWQWWKTFRRCQGIDLGAHFGIALRGLVALLARR